MQMSGNVHGKAKYALFHVVLMAALLPGWLIYVCIYNFIMWCHKVKYYMNVPPIRASHTKEEAGSYSAVEQKI